MATASALVARRDVNAVHRDIDITISDSQSATSATATISNNSACTTQRQCAGGCVHAHAHAHAHGSSSSSVDICSSCSITSKWSWSEPWSHIRIAAAILLLTMCLCGMWFYAATSDSPHLEVVQALKCTTGILKRNDIPYFLDYGSLLGAVRHLGFIPAERFGDDVDIGILTRDVDRIKAVASEFSACGMPIIDRDGVSHLQGISSFAIRRGAFRVFSRPMAPFYIDLADYDIVTDDAGNRIIRDNHYAKLEPYSIDDILPTKPCTFEGLILECPNNSAKMLRQLYGETWTIPIQGMHFKG
jgi:LicD family